MVPPNVAYLLQKEDSKRDMRKMKKDLRLKDCEWVIYPINDKDDPDKWNGGDHWSLLLYRKM